jgi:hypothetical protein
MVYIIILVYSVRSLWLSRPTIRKGVRSVVLVLLGTHHIFHYIASRVAKFLSLNFFSQIYMGWFLIVFPGISTRWEHFSKTKVLIMTPYTSLNRELHADVSPIGALA